MVDGSPAQMTSRDYAAERSDAGRLYLLSICLPFAPFAVAVGLMFVGFLPCCGVPASVIAFGFLVALAFGLSSKSPFARWHTAQWALFTLPLAAYIGVAWALKAVDETTFWNMDGFLVLGLLVLGVVWYALMFVRRGQVNRGGCWLWKLIVPAAHLPRPWPTSAAAPAPPGAPDPTFHVFQLPDAAYRQGCGLRDLGRKADAARCFMQALREGELELRRQAVARLEELGEVEVF
jgi:hypothetical protein